MSGTPPGDIERLADRLTDQKAPVQVRIAVVTAINLGVGRRVQCDITDTAWIPRSQDVALAVGDRVWLIQEGPIFVVGGRLSGDPSTPQVKQKMNVQSVTSSTTIVNDTELAVTLAIGVYRIELFALVGNPVTSDDGDVRSAWSNTGTMLNNGRFCIGPGPASTDNRGNTTAAGSGITRATGHALATEVVYGITDGASSVIHEDLLVGVSVAGILQWQWAQGTSSSTATSVQANSRIVVTPIQNL
jgi:hypothetical protein